MTIDQMMSLFQLYFAGMEEDQLYITRAIFQSPEHLKVLIDKLDKRIVYLENLNRMRDKQDAKKLHGSQEAAKELYDRLDKMEMADGRAEGCDA